jgi:aspartyl-tRNA synthetase
MIKIDKLNSWRRTHYSDEIVPELENQKVTVFGWISSIRTQGQITFLILNDKNGIVQITSHENRLSLSLINKIKIIKEHFSVGIQGTVKSIHKAPHGAEIIPNEILILSTARQQPPFSTFGGQLPNIDKRLDIRAIDLRRTKPQSIFKIRHLTLNTIREFLILNGYFEINTPKIIATATEGGATLFPILYYDKEAFLAQSPQLYKEQLVIPFEKVFEIGPVFRAEQSRTLRHLSQIISIDIEEAYVSYNDIIKTIQKLVTYTIKKISEKCKEETKALEHNLKIPKSFPIFTYDQIIDKLNMEGEKITWGEDLSTNSLKILGKIIPLYYFITDWPTDTKPFYIKPSDKKPEISEAFDFMYGATELASGGTRINSKRLLTKRIRDQGLKPKNFEYHLKIFDYGMPPHAGFGLGLERFMMVLTNQQNIREVTMFPRDQFRLIP